MKQLNLYTVFFLSGALGCAHHAGKPTTTKTSAPKPNQGITMQEISFESQGERIAGNLYLPVGKEPFPAVLVAGSWTTVKEQMAGHYAKALAQKGFAALAIDTRGFGESGGEPRFYESPEGKIKDYKNAIDFLENHSAIDKNHLGALGICAGAGYIARLASEDSRVTALGLVASWLHDAEAVKFVYGGAEGVAHKIKQAQQAKDKYRTTGEVDYVPNISETDASAAMFGPFTYYLDKDRGAIPEWGDKFAVMSWEDWLTFNPLPSAEKIEQPIVMIHSDDAVMPDYAKQFYENLAAKEKHLHWTTGGQFDFYDQSTQVKESIHELTRHFNKHL